MTGRTVVSADDFRRLKAMIRAARQTRRYGTYLNALERALRRAQLLPPSHVPGDAVTMNSVVRVRDPHDDAGRRRVVTVVYPHHAGAGRGALSVLVPLGTAILGARVGDVIRAPTADGVRSFVVEAVLYQPEAAGDFHL